ncbi:uncharacterized protein LOC116378905, partial [Anarrhichthys ocellatus]|uniref:uncharacterized protein LOC116378905 n=1 Tax=Anarrhichthys ocellatus TaxID=433405 RepID=UPI0012ECE1FC
LQCHFTWDLDPSKTNFLRLSDKLVDMGTEEGNSWLGHIYNLRGFIQYKLGFTEDAQSPYLLWVYRHYVAIDEAIDLAEKALEQHPDERCLKRCAALYYKWKIILSSDSCPKQSMIDRAISLHKEVVSLYPHSSFVNKVDLANIYAKSNHGQAKAEQMYQELLEIDLKPADKQLVYNNYAKYLNYDRQDHNKSIKYHMKAAEIPHQSYYRRNSIKILEKIKSTRRNPMWREIEEFLENLQKP